MVLNSQMACDALGALKEQRRGMKGGSKDATGWAARSGLNRRRRRRRECARQIRQSDGQDKLSDRIDALADGSETLGGWCWVGDGEDEVRAGRRPETKANCWGSALETVLAPPPILGVLFTRLLEDYKPQPITPSSPTSSPAWDSSKRPI